MPIQFSFISKHDFGLPLGPVFDLAEADVEKADPLPWMEHEKQMAGLVTVPAPAPSTGGLAALAVQQSTSGPLGPPAKRMASFVPHAAPAIAASLALAAQLPASDSVADLPPAAMPLPAPLMNPFHPAQSAAVQSRELAQCRLELGADIEQVREDLFSAAMSVSALKDRLEDLETTVGAALLPPLVGTPSSHAPLAGTRCVASDSPAPVAEIPAEVMAAHAQAWLDAHLPTQVEKAVQQALEAALGQAVEKAVASLSSNEFFRLPAQFPGVDITPFSQAPQILSSSTLP